MQNISYYKEADAYEVSDNYGGTTISVEEMKVLIRVVRKTHPELLEHEDVIDPERICDIETCKSKAVKMVDDHGVDTCLCEKHYAEHVQSEIKMRKIMKQMNYLGKTTVVHHG
jgi:hypothetical protein